MKKQMNELKRQLKKHQDGVSDTDDASEGSDFDASSSSESSTAEEEDIRRVVSHRFNQRRELRFIVKFENGPMREISEQALGQRSPSLLATYYERHSNDIMKGKYPTATECNEDKVQNQRKSSIGKRKDCIRRTFDASVRQKRQRQGPKRPLCLHITLS